MRKISAALIVAMLTFTGVSVATSEPPVTTKTFDLDGGAYDVTVKIQDGCPISASTIYGYTLKFKKCISPLDAAQQVWEHQNRLTK